jgi:HK97 family phage portal protein
MGLRSWLLKPLFASGETGDWFTAFRDLLEAHKTAAGVSVTQTTAMGLPAVYRCISLNADTIASTPIHTMRRVGGKRVSYPQPRWMESPNDWMDFSEFLGQMQASLEADGNAFALKATTSNGHLAGLFPLNPGAVQIERLPGGGLAYDVAQEDGTAIRIYANEMLHIRGFTPAGEVRGISPIAALKQTIGLGLAAQQFGAQFFSSGANLSGVIEIPGADPGEDVAERMNKSFTRKHGGLSKSHAIGVLFGGAKWVPISVKPEEAQFLETRKSNAAEIACAFGVPSWLVTDAEGAKGFVSGLYATMYMWLQIGINTRFVRIERALSPLLPDRAAYTKFNRNAFLAMDPTERAAFYEAGLRGKWLVPNEIREKEDMNALVGGDEPLKSVQWLE